jgi:hypothetical protein
VIEEREVHGLDLRAAHQLQVSYLIEHGHIPR